VKYLHEIAGFNSRLDEIQAAVLRVKLRHLDRENAARAWLAVEYAQALSGLPLTMPDVLAGSQPAWHLMVVRSTQREALQAHLTQCGIGHAVHYPTACHLQQAYAGSKWPALPIAEQLQREVLSLPMAPYLTRADVLAVADAIGSCRY